MQIQNMAQALLHSMPFSQWDYSACCCTAQGAKASTALVTDGSTFGHKNIKCFFRNIEKI
jgi:hypothetical protein